MGAVMTHRERDRRNLNPTPEAVLAAFVAIFEHGQYPGQPMDYWDTLNQHDQGLFRAMSARIIRAWQWHQSRQAGGRR